MTEEYERCCKYAEENLKLKQKCHFTSTTVFGVIISRYGINPDPIQTACTNRNATPKVKEVPPIIPGDTKL